MPTNRIDIILNADDRATKSIKRFENETKKSATQIKKSFSEIALKVTAVIVAIESIRRTTSAFIEAASKVEDLKTRLTVLTGSLEKGNELFAKMADLAGRVPFTYDEIMESAVNLRAVVRNGNEEVEKFMPIILDLAATTGLGIQETTSQMIRMYSAGAGAADLFRERGVLAMLGFQAGVSYSAEETMDRVIAAWEDGGSRFRGATDLLATTWTGKVSMMQDAWFKFKAEIGETVINSDVMTAGIGWITDSLNLMAESMKGSKEEGRGLVETLWRIVTPAGAVVDTFDRMKQQADDDWVGNWTEKFMVMAEEMGILNETALQSQEELISNGERWEQNTRNNIEAFKELQLSVEENSKTIGAGISKMANSMNASFATAFSNIIQGTSSAKEAFSQLGKSLVSAIADFIAQMIVAATIGKAIKAAETALMISMGATIATAWAPAAALVSLATLGGNAAPASAGMVATSALSYALAVPKLAEGGIVKARPGGILAQIGEGGRDEAVIPLDSAGGAGFGDINIFIQGGINPDGLGVSQMAEQLGFEFERRVRVARG